MKRVVFKKSPLRILLSALAPALFSLAVIGLIFYGIEQTERSGRAEGLRLLEEALLRAAVTCYAVEGRYPESLEYMETQYGVQVDKTRYAVYYEVFASNILPDITVIER